MTLSLVKAHAYGNDFLLLPHPPSHLADAADLARHVCDRHRGIGADGLILVDRTPDGARTRLWNADGSQPEVSGTAHDASGRGSWRRHRRQPARGSPWIPKRVRSGSS
jgi:diaminopimelate epimerase